MPAKQILEALLAAAETPTRTGYVLRRVLPDSILDLFIGWERPTGLPVLLLQVPSLIPLHGLDDISTRAVHVHSGRLPDDVGGRKSVVVTLTELSLLDEFCLVLDQLVRGLQVICTADDAVRLLAARLRAWLLLFSPDTGRMSDERQRGLFGELTVLETLANRKPGWIEVLRAWTGPDRRDRDFNFTRLLIEVKTNIAGGRDRIQVTNEHQLDGHNGVPPLLLWVLTLAQDEKGVTLPARVKGIRTILEADPTCLVLFEEKIEAAGYSDLQFEPDHSEPYRVVTQRIYHVLGDFPHLRPSDLRPGVLNVSYSVDLKDCVRFLNDENAVYELLTPDTPGGT